MKIGVARGWSLPFPNWDLRAASISDRFEGMTAEQKALLADVVWVDPDRLSGVPCFKGTRVPIQALIDHIEGNSTLEDFLEGFPSVTREQAVQFIELAKDNLLACVSS
jgi:uncharacterized protein (DUF433 family)